MKIYTVTTLEKVELNEQGFLACGSQRTPGFFKTAEDAKECIENNYGDIFEYLYEYATIEEIEDGLYPISNEIGWYKWDDEKKKYCEIPKPEETKHFVNYSIG